METVSLVTEVLTMCGHSAHLTHTLPALSPPCSTRSRLRRLRSPWLATVIVVVDGDSNWVEGLPLMAVYLILRSRSCLVADVPAQQ